MSTVLNWGLIGTGNIARQFAAGVRASRRGRLWSVGSRSVDSAKAFAGAFSVPQAHGDYQGIIADPQVGAVYIALPNSMHCEWTIKALQAGKHVLCEKPIAANAAQAEEMFDVAGRAGRVLVEAFMYRAHPLTHAVCGCIQDGAIGKVRLVRTSFCFRTARIENNIRFDPRLAGGALMDVGCYCINFSRLIAGEEPSTVCVAAQKHASGVDEAAVGMLAFPGGVLASFTCGMTVHADNTAYVCGTDGYVQVPVPWKPLAGQGTYTIARGTPPRMDHAAGSAPAAPPREVRSVDVGTDVYAVEADDFAATVLDGRPAMVGRADSVGNMRVLDEMRRQLGIMP